MKLKKLRLHSIALGDDIYARTLETEINGIKHIVVQLNQKVNSIMACVINGFVGFIVVPMD